MMLAALFFCFFLHLVIHQQLRTFLSFFSVRSIQTNPGAIQGRFEEIGQAFSFSPNPSFFGRDHVRPFLCVLSDAGSFDQAIVDTPKMAQKEAERSRAGTAPRNLPQRASDRRSFTRVPPVRVRFGTALGEALTPRVSGCGREWTDCTGAGKAHDSAYLPKLHPKLDVENSFFGWVQHGPPLRACHGHRGFTESSSVSVEAR